MINNISDLNLDPKDEMSTIEQKIKEKLDINLSTMKDALSNFVKTKSNDLAQDFINIIPYGDYSKLLEDTGAISQFLQEEACKIENWSLSYIAPSDVNPDLSNLSLIMSL